MPASATRISTLLALSICAILILSMRDACVWQVQREPDSPSAVSVAPRSPRGEMLPEFLRRAPSAQNDSASFFDHFDGTSLDKRWVAITGGTGAVSIADSFAELTSRSGSGAAALLHAARLERAKSQLWVFAISNHSGEFPQWWVTLVSGGAPPTADTRATYHSKLVARINSGLLGCTPGVQFEYWDSQRERKLWNGRANRWSAAPVFANSPIRHDDYYLIGLEFDGPGDRWRMLAWGRRSPTVGAWIHTQGLRLFAVSDWVPWKETASGGDPWLVIGDPLTDAMDGTLRVEWIRHSAGNKVDAWVNSRDATGTYHIRHWYGYAGPLGVAEVFIPEARGTWALDVGPSGAWDATRFGVKDQYVVQDGSTYYLFYNSNTQIGLATATDPSGPWTKEPANPILQNIPGGEESNVIFPAVVKDLSETDSSQVWKMLYTGYQAGGKHRLFYATAPAPQGPWTRRGKILDAGPPGSIDENGVNRARPVWHDGQWYVFHGARNAAARGFWNVSYSTGPDFTHLTKSGQTLVPRKTNAVQRITEKPAGRVIHVRDTSGFEEEGFVGVRSASGDENPFAVSRIRRVLDQSTLELYHGLDGIPPGLAAEILQHDSDQVKDQVAMVVPSGSAWFLYITNFDGGRGEINALLAAPQITGPYVWLPFDAPVVTHGSWGDGGSNENVVFVNQPVNRNTPPARRR